MNLFADEDVSPNENLTFSTFKQQPKITTEKPAAVYQTNQEPDDTKQSVKGMSSNDILLLALQELHNERYIFIIN